MCRSPFRPRGLYAEDPLLYLLTAVTLTLLLDSPVCTGEKPAVKTFVNSKEGLAKNLLKDYVDFSFDYPATWELADRKKDPSNFVKVERGIGSGNDFFTLENFAVGNLSLSGKAEVDKKLMTTQLLPILDAQFKAGFPNYKKTAQGETKFGSYEGIQLRFTSEFTDKNKGLIQIWGRAVMIADPKGGHNGAFVMMLGTSVAPELKGEQDLGEKGSLPIIIRSFKMGK